MSIFPCKHLIFILLKSLSSLKPYVMCGWVCGGVHACVFCAIVSKHLVIVLLKVN